MIKIAIDGIVLSLAFIFGFIVGGGTVLSLISAVIKAVKKGLREN